MVRVRGWTVPLRVRAEIPKTHQIGIHRTNPNIVNKVLKDGLRLEPKYGILTSQVSMASRNYFALKSELMKRHRESRCHFVISLPIERIVAGIRRTVGKEELKILANQLDRLIPEILNHNIPPEFIVGYYDPIKHKWAKNPKFSPSHQIKVSQQAKEEIRRMFAKI